MPDGGRRDARAAGDGEARTLEPRAGRHQVPVDHRAAFRRAQRPGGVIKLNGALELAPRLGLCRRVVDLVSTGATLRANGLVEVETVAHITSRLAVNRAALKTRSEEINRWIDRFRDALDAG